MKNALGNFIWVNKTLAFSFFILRWGLVLLPRLECIGPITAHCSLNHLASSNPYTSASLVAGTACVSPSPDNFIIIIIIIIIIICRDKLSLCCASWSYFYYNCMYLFVRVKWPGIWNLSKWTQCVFLFVPIVR